MYYIGEGGFHDRLSAYDLSIREIDFLRPACFFPRDLSRRREKNTTLLLDSPMKIPEVRSAGYLSSNGVAPIAKCDK